MKIILREAKLGTVASMQTEIQVQHGDYEAVKGKLFVDVLTLPHGYFHCSWCEYVKNRFTLRTDWRTYSQMELDKRLGISL